MVCQCGQVCGVSVWRVSVWGVSVWKVSVCGRFEGRGVGGDGYRDGGGDGDGGVKLMSSVSVSAGRTCCR